MSGIALVILYFLVCYLFIGLHLNCGGSAKEMPLGYTLVISKRGRYSFDLPSGRRDSTAYRFKIHAIRAAWWSLRWSDRYDRNHAEIDSMKPCHASIAEVEESAVRFKNAEIVQGIEGGKIRSSLIINLQDGRNITSNFLEDQTLEQIANHLERLAKALDLLEPC